MIWVGGAQGAGKTIWSWRLSRAHDLPLHPIDLWAYDHQARLPDGDSLDDQLARGPEAAADAFESVRERLAKTGTLGGRPVAARSPVHRLVERDAVIAGRVRASALRSERPVIEVPPLPDWPAVAAAAESAVARALRSAPRLAPGRELSRQRRYENRAADRQGRLWMGDAGLTVAPSYPFGCECGTSGCRATWTATPDDYAARTAGERPLIAH
jgi:hypothetical protein